MPAWRHFESDVRDLAEHLGYGAVTTPASGDEGVDVLARRGDRIVAIQCKLYNATRVNSDAIQKLLASRVIHNATDFICITSGKFTRSALDLAGKTGVLAIDGPRLRELCAKESFSPRAMTRLKGTDQEWELAADEIRIGRADDSEILVSNMAVSRSHGRFRRNGLRLFFTDVGSTYGTWINGKRVVVNEPYLVRPGDAIRLAVEEYELAWAE